MTATQVRLNLELSPLQALLPMVYFSVTLDQWNRTVLFIYYIALTYSTLLCRYMSHTFSFIINIVCLISMQTLTCWRTRSQNTILHDGMALFKCALVFSKKAYRAYNCICIYASVANGSIRVYFIKTICSRNLTWS